VAVGAEVGVGPAGGAVTATVVIGTRVATAWLAVGTGGALAVVARAHPARNRPDASNLNHAGRMPPILPSCSRRKLTRGFGLQSRHANACRARPQLMTPLELKTISARGLLKVVAAKPGELETVMGILAEASADLVKRGVQQWPSPPPPALWRLIEQHITLGQVYLARLAGSGELAGTVRFTWRYESVWPEDPDSAGYVHTLAIRPALRGRQLGVALLAWAAGHVRAYPRRLLRLDCMASGQRLRQYYERLGFADRGLAAIDGYELARYELDVRAEVSSIGDSQCT